MEPTSTRKQKRLAGDDGPQGLEPLLRIIEMICIHNHQWPTRSDGFPRW